MKIDVIHRHDPGGPEATIDCDDNGSVLAVWEVESGQLLDTHPVLNTGGYVYYTLDSEPSNVITQEEGGSSDDFSGAPLSAGQIQLTLGQTESGVVYRAHILLAYEDGPTFHNDTRFTCESVTSMADSVNPMPDVLPFTGFDLTGLIIVASLLMGLGVSLLRRWGFR